MNSETVMTHTLQFDTFVCISVPQHISADVLILAQWYFYRSAWDKLSTNFVHIVDFGGLRMAELYLFEVVKWHIHKNLQTDFVT